MSLNILTHFDTLFQRLNKVTNCTKNCEDWVRGTLDIELFINEQVKKTNVGYKDHLNPDSAFELPIQIMEKSRRITFLSTISALNTDRFYSSTVL